MTVPSLPPGQGAGFFSWGAKTYVMAIINATPDSFSGDGIASTPDVAGDRAAAAVANGADVIDIGAESTRPGHRAIDASEELTRLLPALQAVSTRVNVPISIDTSKASVADAALRAGAHIVNDVSGLTRDPDIASVIAAHGVPAVIMHDLPSDGHGDLVTGIVRELSRRLDRAVAAGISWDHLIIDPGFGFGKNWNQNLELLRRLRELRVLGRPILVGTSRKGTIGHVLGLPEHDRIEGTAATVALAIANGADIVRVHDVREMVRVGKMTDAVVRTAPAGRVSSAAASHRPGDDEEHTEDLPVNCRSSVAYIALGANLGDRLATLTRAVERLTALGVIESISHVYETEPVGFADQPAFLNAVISLVTGLGPQELMSSLLHIEHALGRVRSFANAPRSIDLDLLLYSEEVIEDPTLTVPHPRMHERAFVLVPLNDIAPDVIHPQLELPIRQLLQRVGSTHEVRRTHYLLDDIARNA